MQEKNSNNYHGSAFHFMEGRSSYFVVFRCMEIPEPATGISLAYVKIISVKNQFGQDCLPELDIEQIERESCIIAIENIISRD